jgi:hypothetical protein
MPISSTYDFTEIEQSLPRSIFVECRQWFDKLNGNTYYSNRIWVDGDVWKIQDMTYGYETAYIHGAIKELIDGNVLSIATANPYTIRQAGIDFYHTAHFVRKSELFKKGVHA